MDHTLELQREAWHEAARYRVIRDDRLPKDRRTVVASGLTLAEARAECARLDPIVWRQMGHSSTSFYRSIHFIEMENNQYDLRVMRGEIGRSRSVDNLQR